MPPHGLGSATDAWGTQMAIAGDELFSADDEALDNGRIVEVDLSCLSAVPQLHWIDAELVIPARASWPAAEERLQLDLDLPFDTGRPYGLRSASTSVVVDYLLDITGVPCSFDYSTSICSYGAYTIRDGASAASTAPFPIDPSGGAPQFYSTGAGPMFSATSSSTVQAWPFRFQASNAFVPPIPPTGQPLDLRFQAQSYNCVDFAGTWYPEIPHVTGHCFLEALPTSLRSLTFQATVTGEVALELPPLGPGLQGTVCAGGMNGAGIEAGLEAVGSSAVSDDALFVQVAGLPPGSAGMLFLAPQAATLPFETLGFGQLCLGAPYRRAPSTVTAADASGNATARLVLSELPVSARPQPGSTWTLQWMYRDRGSVNTSSARTVLFQ